MKKSQMWFAAFFLIQIIIMVIMAFNFVPSNTKIFLAIVFLGAEIAIYEAALTKSSSPNKYLPDDNSIQSIITELNLNSVLNDITVLKEYDNYKSYENKERSIIAKAYIPNKYYKNRDEYKNYVSFQKWETIISQLALQIIINDTQLFEKNKHTFVELVANVYGYRFYKKIDYDFLYAIKEIKDFPDNVFFVYELLNYIQDRLYQYVCYCFYMRNNVTRDGFIKWIKILIEKSEIKEDYIDVIIPMLEKTHISKETDTAFFQNVNDMEIEKYLNEQSDYRKLYLRNHFNSISFN